MAVPIVFSIWSIELKSSTIASPLGGAGSAGLNGFVQPPTSSSASRADAVAGARAARVGRARFMVTGPR
jgi:hypothetical protein